MVALELAIGVEASDPILTAFGREQDFVGGGNNYPIPDDLDRSARWFRANCGPASFAAITGLLITDIIRFFPQFPAMPHTNVPRMKEAFESCGIEAEDFGAQWPADGLCLIQITGPWTDRAWPHAACEHRHWVGVRNGFVYDVNLNAWLPRAKWQQSVMNKIAEAHSQATGWLLLKAFQIDPRPVAFPEFSA